MNCCFSKYRLETGINSEYVHFNEAQELFPIEVALFFGASPSRIRQLKRRKIAQNNLATQLANRDGVAADKDAGYQKDAELIKTSVRPGRNIGSQ